jgi:hypothetical protein
MAIPFMQMPAYNPGNSLLNFEPIQQALQQKIRKDQMDLENQFRERDFGMREQDFAARQKEREDASLDKLKKVSANLALTALEDPDQNRGQAAFMQWYQSDPRWSNGFKKAGIDPAKDWRAAAERVIADAGVDLGARRAENAERQAKLGLMQAQTAKAQREASGQNTDYGKSGAIMQGPDGRFYTVQFGSRGERQILPVDVGGQNLAPAKGVQTVDDGTGTRIISGATGGEVQPRIPKDIVGREKAEAVGKAAGELETSFPKAQASLRAVSESQRIVLGAVDEALGRVNSYTAGMLGTLLSQLPGTEARDLKRTLLTIKGNIGFDKLQDMRANSPTGGALGQVAVQELETLQAVLGALEPDQTPAQLVRNLTAVRDTLQRFQRLREQAFADTYAPVLQSRGQTAPRMEFNNLPPGVTVRKID